MIHNANLGSVLISEIETNKENPRGAKAKDKDNNFDYLKRSINKLGLLVPILVKKQKNKDKPYLLIDGERRYWASLGVGLEKIDANILPENVTKKEIQEYMFHIHNNRTAWGPAQECNALEEYYKKIKNKYKKSKDDLIADLVRYTGDAKSTVEERVLFLNWPKDIREKVYNDESYEEFYWIIVAIEKHAIILAKNKIPEYFEKVRENEVRISLLNKYIEKSVKKGTETRKLEEVFNYNNDAEKKECKRIFHKLVKQIDYTFEDAKEEYTTLFPRINIAKLISDIDKDIKKLERGIKITGNLELKNDDKAKLGGIQKTIQSILNK